MFFFNQLNACLSIPGVLLPSAPFHIQISVELSDFFITLMSDYQFLQTSQIQKVEASKTLATLVTACPIAFFRYQRLPVSEIDGKKNI